MDINSIMETFLNLNWQTVIGIFAIVWYFTHDLKLSIQHLDKRIDTLEERMFLLSTGKTLAQAILEEKMKNERH